MHRRTMLASATIGFSAPTPQPALASTEPGLAAAGWTHTEYDGIRPASFRSLPDGVAMEGQGAGSFVWRRVPGQPACLTWRWRVEAAPPPTDLTRRGGDDRAIAIAVGFQGWPTRSTVWQRTQHAVAQARAGSHVLPRSMLIYAWGGTGQEPPSFYSPWMGGLGRVRILRPAQAPTGRWFEERVDLAAEWRTAFGGEPPPLQEIAIGTDADDTQARFSAMVERIRFAACA